MTPPGNHGRLTKKEALRWSVCFAAVLLLHGGLAAALISGPQDEGDVRDSIHSVEVEFTSEAFKDALAHDVAPGEEQIQTDIAPPPTEKTEQAHEPETPAPPPLQADDPEVSLPKQAEAPKDVKEAETNQSVSVQPAMTSAPATTAPTAAAVRSASAVSWKRRIALHLQRNKRYPAAAQSRREHGTARVAFLIDRAGRVVSSTIIGSSGSAALDAETLALLRRAQPLPAPPADVPGTEFSFNVPVRFDLQ